MPAPQPLPQPLPQPATPGRMRSREASGPRPPPRLGRARGSYAGVTPTHNQPACAFVLSLVSGTSA